MTRIDGGFEMRPGVGLAMRTGGGIGTRIGGGFQMRTAGCFDENTQSAPHQKTPLTTPVGRLIERASYSDLIAAGVVTIFLSTTYFVLAPCGHSLNNQPSVFDAVYFSVVTFTSLGYGELQPIGFGRGIAMAVVLVGVALIALLVGKFASERQQSILLLLHTSDCQRRLNEFSTQLDRLGERLQTAVLLGRCTPMQQAAKQLSERVQVLSNYLVFNANQARLIEFGNESSLLALYRQLAKLQALCISIHKAEKLDLLVSRRTLSVANRCSGLMQLMHTFHSHADQNTSYLGGLVRWVRKVLRKPHEVVPSPLSKRVSTIYEAMSSEARLLKLWTYTSVTPKAVEDVWSISPSGVPATWPQDIRKHLAVQLNISNALAQKCLKRLLQSGRLPK